jgi:hypothetical protein
MDYKKVLDISRKITETARRVTETLGYEGVTMAGENGCHRANTSCQWVERF